MQKAISGVLADQAASGSFGLWGPEGAGNDLWLDAYVTDFLTRATEKGYDVPDLARTLALDNLSNRIAYASDFDKGGEDIAYCALRAGPHRPGGDRRPPLLRRLEARGVPHAACQGADRRGDGALRRPPASGQGVRMRRWPTSTSPKQRRSGGATTARCSAIRRRC